MSIYTLNGKRINIYSLFTAEDGTHGIDLTRPENREKYNIVEQEEPTPPDDYSDKFYYRTEQDEAPFVVYTRKSDEQIAQMLQAETNAKSLAYLASTDWMVTRFAETGVPIPDDVKAARQAAREAIVKVQP